MKISDSDFEKLLQSEEKHSYNKTIAFQGAPEKPAGRPAFRRLAVIAVAALLAAGLIAVGIVTAAKLGEETPAVTDIDFTGYKTVFSGDRNIVVYEVKDICEQIEEFFGDKSKRGFIGRITPLEYRFFYDIREDEFTDAPYIDGFAECVCEINKISTKYNSSGVNDKETVTVCLDLYLSPSDSIIEKTLMDLMTNIGAYKNGKTKTGVYTIPAKYVNENDFNILTHDPRGVLPLHESYYAFITEDERGNCWFSYVCPTSDDTLTRMKWEDDIKQSALNFRQFVFDAEKSVTE